MIVPEVPDMRLEGFPVGHREAVLREVRHIVPDV